MKHLMGIINLSENEEQIRGLTYNRPIGSIPFAGRYRIIDFILSNMVNAKINNIAIFTQGKSRSLMGHIGTGKDWDLDRNVDGLFIFNPEIDINDIQTHKGDIENFKNHLDYIKYSRQKYILLTRSYMVCNIDLCKAYQYHQESNADITIIYKKIKGNHVGFKNCNTLNIDDNNRVLSIGRNTQKEGYSNISMEMYIMKKELLLELIQNTIQSGEVEHIKQAIIKNIKTLNVNAYEFKGHLSCIHSTEEYYHASMDLLDSNIAHELFHQNGLIYTKSKNEPSTKYTRTAEVNNSLIANGCIIEGRVENSIIGRGVHIAKNAFIKDSIIMNKGGVEEGALLNNVILDKFVYVTKNSVLSGDCSNPLVIRKGLRI